MLDGEKLVQPPADEAAPLVEKDPVATHLKESAVGGDTLRLECRDARLLDQWRKVLARRLVADPAVGLATDEGKIGDVIGLATAETVFQDRLRKYVVKLKPMFGAAVSQRNYEVRMPVACIGSAESEDIVLKRALR